MNVGRKNFSSRIGLSAEIDSTDDFQNSYTCDDLNRLTQLDQSAAGSVGRSRQSISVTIGGCRVGEMTDLAIGNSVTKWGMGLMETACVTALTIPGRAGRIQRCVYARSPITNSCVRKRRGTELRR